MWSSAQIDFPDSSLNWEYTVICIWFIEKTFFFFLRWAKRRSLFVSSLPCACLCFLLQKTLLHESNLYFAWYRRPKLDSMHPGAWCVPVYPEEDPHTPAPSRWNLKSLVRHETIFRLYAKRKRFCGKWILRFCFRIEIAENGYQAPVECDKLKIDHHLNI